MLAKNDHSIMFRNKLYSDIKMNISDLQPVQWAKQSEIEFGYLSEHIPKNPVRTFEVPWFELFCGHMCT